MATRSTDPVSVTVSTQDQAYQQGQQAARNGLSVMACPYKTAKLMGLRRVWLAGYNEMQMAIESEEASPPR